MRHRFYRRYGKRLLDLGLAAVAMVLLALPMLVIAGVVRATSPGPALFWQRRVGARKVYFMMPKFHGYPPRRTHPFAPGPGAVHHSRGAVSAQDLFG